MARLKKHSICWTICYAVEDPSNEGEFYTGKWFAYGRSREEAKESFLRERKNLHEDCGDPVPPEAYQVLNIVEGFSC